MPHKFANCINMQSLKSVCRMQGGGEGINPTFITYKLELIFQIFYLDKNCKWNSLIGNLLEKVGKSFQPTLKIFFSVKISLFFLDSQTYLVQQTGKPSSHT